LRAASNHGRKEVGVWRRSKHVTVNHLPTALFLGQLILVVFGDSPAIGMLGKTGVYFLLSLVGSFFGPFLLLL
jgi:hypothetical protein